MRQTNFYTTAIKKSLQINAFTSIQFFTRYMIVIRAVLPCFVKAWLKRYAHSLLFFNVQVDSLSWNLFHISFELLHFSCFRCSVNSAAVNFSVTLPLPLTACHTHFLSYTLSLEQQPYNWHCMQKCVRTLTVWWILMTWVFFFSVLIVPMAVKWSHIIPPAFIFLHRSLFPPE